MVLPRLILKKTMALILNASLTLSCVAFSGEIQMPCHEAALWRHPPDKGLRPANNQVSEFGMWFSVQTTALADSLITTS